MRHTLIPVAAAALVGLAALGCGDKKGQEYSGGPTVDKFAGKLVSDGKPVAFGPEEKVQLKLVSEKGESFNVPVKADGTFDIGWMPVSRYSATLIRENVDGAKKGSAAGGYHVPGGLTVKDGQTDYTVELGKGWKK